jgi:hypothetical protein
MYKFEIANAGILPENTGQVQIWSHSDDFFQLHVKNRAPPNGT